MSLIICSSCKSEYRITQHVSDFVQSDEECCKVCGAKLMSWKKSKMVYKSKLKVKRAMHINRKKSLK